MKKKLLKLFFRPLTVLNQVMPKDKKLIFFYSNLGFRDNVKAMFDYLIEKHYNQRYYIVCAINEDDAYRTLAVLEPEKYKNVKFVGCKEGIRYFLRCSIGFYSFGKYPIKPATSQTIINLWHGMPLKRIGNMEERYKKIDYNYFTYILVTSAFYGNIIKRCFNCTDEQLLIEGQPRNDVLFTALNKEQQQLKKMWKKIVLWLPTYREDEKNWKQLLFSKKNQQELDEYLKNNQIKLIVKLHPLSRKNCFENTGNIEYLNQEAMEKKYGNLYELLKLSDGLITDYSSIYFDYLLLDRPIAFTVADIKEYETSRGFVFDNPEDYMPGMKISGDNDLIEFIWSIQCGEDMYKSARNEINKLVNTYKDGHSCERIAERYLSDI